MKASQLSGGIVNKVRTITGVTTTDLTLTYNDQEVVVNRAAAVNITIPVNLEVGKTFRLHDIGAGRLKLVGQTDGPVSVTLLSESGSGLFESMAQNNVIDLIVIAANTVMVKGNVNIYIPN